MTDFFTLEQFGTAAGIVAFVTAMVEVCKFLIPVSVNSKWYCIGWSVVSMVAYALWVNPATSPAEWFTAMINALLIAAASTGAFEFIVRPAEQTLLIAREAQQQIDTSTDGVGEDG